jgi:YfiH family protein
MIFPDLFDGHVMGFFTTRNLGVDIQEMTGRKVYFPIQEHTDTVIELDPDLTEKAGDAVITDRFDVILGVKTADCVPILVFDTQRLVIGAVHAGWRGTSKGILKQTISRLSQRYKSDPSNLLVTFGPSIGQCCYEVGEDVLGTVRGQTGEGDYIKVSGNKHFLDLKEANRLQALSSGVPGQGMSVLEECTRCNKDRFFSYRRNSQSPGRQGGFIGLP